MSKKITALTPDQEQLLPQIRDGWLDAGLSTRPANWHDAALGIHAAYLAAGLRPPRIIIRVASPWAGVLARAIAPEIIACHFDLVGAQVGAQVGDQVGAQVGDQVGDQVGAQVDAQVGDQVGDQVRAQVGDQVGAQVYAQVGAQVDAQVRDLVGDQVGAQVGDQVGAQVRAQVRDQVRAQVDAQVGDQVDDQVRDQVGDQVRDQVYDQVDAQVYDQVRAQVGDQVYDQVGDQVGDQVDDQVYDQVYAQVRDQVYDQVGDQVGDQVDAQVRAQVRDQVYAQVRDQVRDQVYAQVRDQVGDQVYAQVGDQGVDQVRDQVYAQVRKRLPNWWDGRMLGQHWAAYYSYYYTMGQLGVTECRRLAGQMLTALSAGWWWCYQDFAIVTDRPAELHRDAQGRLHRAGGMAVRYRDGWGFYAWHGIRLPADLFETGVPSLERILKQPNSEVRRCAIEMTGWDRLERELGDPVATAADPGNPGRQLALYDVPDGLYETPVRLVLMTNGSPDRSGAERRYGETVPADIDDPLAAQAWAYGVPRSAYAALQRRT